MKNHYRRVLLDKIRGRENFIKMVRECISEKNITRDRVQKFSRRARCYVLGYHILWQMQQGIIHDPDSEELKAVNGNIAIIPAKLEQMVKNSRHTDAPWILTMASVKQYSNKISSPCS
jgi:hypothetical protein